MNLAFIGGEDVLAALEVKILECEKQEAPISACLTLQYRKLT